MYDVDEFGNIVEIKSSYEMSPESAELYPDFEFPDFSDNSDDIQSDPVDDDGNLLENSDIIEVPDTVISYPDGTNVVIPYGSDVSLEVNPPTVFDYDDFVSVLANTPLYTVYPSTNAVAVFSNVVNHIDNDFGYMVVSGPDSNTTYLYYSDKYDVSGSTVNLYSPVTRCMYYQYRPSSSSAYVYTYSVSIVSDISFVLSNQLVYTNLVEGYPDLVPYKMRQSYSLSLIITICVAVLAFGLYLRSWRK